jgi:hypothetical protein
MGRRLEFSGSGLARLPLSAHDAFSFSFIIWHDMTQAGRCFASSTAWKQKRMIL